MKRKLVYCCEYCPSEYEKYEDAVKHEALHFNLTPVGYKDWKDLCARAASAGRVVSVSKNPKTDAEFDKAISELCDFETRYGLTGRRRPSNFL